jgi:hypothetical protein
MNGTEACKGFDLKLPGGPGGPPAVEQDQMSSPPQASGPGPPG